MRHIIGLLLMIIGIVFSLWATYIIVTYDGYFELIKKANAIALPQTIIGVVGFILGYLLTYKKTK